MIPPRKKKSTAVRSEQAKDREKENKINELILQLGTKGLVVRREQLKQGHGWKTLSGICRIEGKAVLFLDRKLPLQEQVVFLSSIASNADTIAKATSSEESPDPRMLKSENS